VCVCVCVCKARRFYKVASHPFFVYAFKCVNVCVCVGAGGCECACVGGKKMFVCVCGEWHPHDEFSSPLFVR